jgi:hypothetical protein
MAMYWDVRAANDRWAIFFAGVLNLDASRLPLLIYFIIVYFIIIPAPFKLKKIDGSNSARQIGHIHAAASGGQ